MKKNTILKLALGAAGTVLGLLVMTKLNNDEQHVIVEDITDAMEDTKGVVVDLFENVKEDITDIIE